MGDTGAGSRARPSPVLTAAGPNLTAAAARRLPFLLHLGAGGLSRPASLSRGDPADQLLPPLLPTGDGDGGLAGTSLPPSPAVRRRSS